MKCSTFVGLKVALASVAAYISDKLGMLVPVMLFLTFCMAADYITGIMATSYEKLKNPSDTNKGLSSSVGMLGIYKKVSYLFAVCVGIGLDWLILTFAEEFQLSIPCETFFGLLIALWYILNELLSIIENIDRIDKTPTWLSGIVKLLQGKIDIKISDEVDGLGSNADDDNKNT